MYKYLGMEEGEGVQVVMKLVLNAELNAWNRIAAINTLAVPVAMEYLIGN